MHRSLNLRRWFPSERAAVSRQADLDVQMSAAAVTKAECVGYRCASRVAHARRMCCRRPAGNAMIWMCGDCVSAEDGQVRSPVLRNNRYLDSYYLHRMLRLLSISLSSRAFCLVFPAAADGACQVARASETPNGRLGSLVWLAPSSPATQRRGLPADAISTSNDT